MKIKHLEFLQNIISRMSLNSFLIKGWSITLLSALFVLLAQNANDRYVLIAYFAIAIFWIMDGFYLSKERQYRSLYIEVSAKNEVDIDFSMDTSNYSKGRNSWFASIFSVTLLPFYGSAIGATLLVMYSVK